MHPPSKFRHSNLGARRRQFLPPLLQLLLVACVLSFIIVQVRMLFTGSECADRLKSVIISEKKWFSEAHSLQANVSVLSKELSMAQEEVQRTKKSYAKVVAELGRLRSKQQEAAAIAQQKLEEQQKQLQQQQQEKLQQQQQLQQQKQQQQQLEQQRQLEQQKQEQQQQQQEQQAQQQVRKEETESEKNKQLSDHDLKIIESIRRQREMQLKKAGQRRPGLSSPGLSKPTLSNTNPAHSNQEQEKEVEEGEGGGGRREAKEEDEGEEGTGEDDEQEQQQKQEEREQGEGEGEEEGAGEEGGEGGKAEGGSAGRNGAEGVVAAVVVMACNRADYLQRTLNSVLKYHEGLSAKFPLFISQDGLNEQVKAMAAKYSSFAYIQNTDVSTPVTERPGENIAYYKIASHYKFALSHLFEELQYPRVIILEDDMDISVDFFDYFEATAALLDEDESILAVSSWNDNGQTQFVHDPKALYRSDFFPGLGWMMGRGLWEELAPKWPKAYWDDWLRLQANRKGRQTIRPEICRTYNFGEQGSSQGQYFSQYLAPIRLNTEKVPWATEDLSYLLDVTYPEYFASELKQAKPLHSPVHVTALGQDLHQDVVLSYDDINGFRSLAQQFGVFPDEKDGIPRTAYQGVVVFRYRGPHRVFLTTPYSFTLLKIKRPRFAAQ